MLTGWFCEDGSAQQDTNLIKAKLLISDKKCELLKASALVGLKSK